MLLLFFLLIGSTNAFCCGYGQYRYFVTVQGLFGDVEEARCGSCSSGTYQDSGVCHTYSYCSACPTGRYEYRSGSRECLLCPVGKYQPSTGQIYCIDCVNGFTTTSTGSPDVSYCSECLPGTYKTASQCVQCEVGRYQDLFTQTSCKRCPVGRYMDEVGSQMCKDCVKGRYQASIGASVCTDCQRGKYQYQTGMQTCLYCPNGRSHILTGQTSPENCLALYQKMLDLPSPVVYTKECEIRDGFRIQCPVCRCFDDSRRGHFDGPVCKQCVRGYGTASCKPKCPGYDGLSDTTLCSQMGACYFGTTGDSVCYCGADGSVNEDMEDIVVDVRDNGIERYFKMYTLDFSVLRIDMGIQWRPTRPMQFELFDPSSIRQNKCSRCSSDSSEAAPNGYTASNCQYECSICLTSGQCDNTPRLGETNTICSCRSIAYGTHDLCCPKGFRPYIDNTDSLPYIKHIQPSLSSQPYFLSNVFYGTEKELCLPCPGLFGLGVYEADVTLNNPQQATDFWWTKPLAAFTKACNTVGTCDFYHDKTSFQYTTERNIQEICLTYREPNKKAVGYTCNSHEECQSGYCDMDDTWGCKNKCLTGVQDVVPTYATSFDPNNDHIVHLPDTGFDTFNASLRSTKIVHGVCNTHDDCYSGICGWYGSCDGRCLTSKQFQPVFTTIPNTAIRTLIDCFEDAIQNKHQYFHVTDDTSCTSSVTNTLQEYYNIPHVCNASEDSTKTVFTPYSLEDIFQHEQMSFENFMIYLQSTLKQLYRSPYDKMFLFRKYVVFYNYNSAFEETHTSFQLLSALDKTKDNCAVEDPLPVHTYVDGMDPALGGNCPAGYYCYDGLKIPCPLGHYSGVEGQSTAFVGDTPLCKKCDAGMSTNGLDGQRRCVYCKKGTYVSDDSRYCVDCPLNTYQDEETLSENGDGVCKACPSGTVSPPGTASASDCNNCDAGQGVVPGGTCEVCPIGTRSQDGICLPCSPGTYQDETGKQTCKACAKGTSQSAEGQSTCVECAAGKVSAQTGLETCTDCFTGKYQDQTGQTVCEDCSIGKYADVDGLDECKACSPSTYADQTGQTSCKPQPTCERGTYACGSGQYVVTNNGGTAQRECADCPPGKFTVLDNGNRCLDTSITSRFFGYCRNGKMVTLYDQFDYANWGLKNHANCLSACYDYVRRNNKEGQWQVCLLPNQDGNFKQNDCRVQQLPRTSCNGVENGDYVLTYMDDCDSSTWGQTSYTRPSKPYVGYDYKNCNEEDC